MTFEVANFGIVSVSPDQPPTTAHGKENEGSEEEHQSREAEKELEQCLAEMGESNPMPAPHGPPGNPPHRQPPGPIAPAPSTIPMWGVIRLRHATGAKSKATNPRR